MAYLRARRSCRADRLDVQHPSLLRRASLSLKEAADIPTPLRQADARIANAWNMPTA